MENDKIIITEDVNGNVEVLNEETVSANLKNAKAVEIVDGDEILSGEASWF